LNNTVGALRAGADHADDAHSDRMTSTTDVEAAHRAGSNAATRFTYELRFEPGLTMT